MSPALVIAAAALAASSGALGVAFRSRPATAQRAAAAALGLGALLGMARRPCRSNTESVTGAASGSVNSMSVFDPAGFGWFCASSRRGTAGPAGTDTLVVVMAYTPRKVPPA